MFYLHQLFFVIPVVQVPTKLHCLTYNLIYSESNQMSSRLFVESSQEQTLNNLQKKNRPKLRVGLVNEEHLRKFLTNKWPL